VVGKNELGKARKTKNIWGENSIGDQTTTKGLHFLPKGFVSQGGGGRRPFCHPITVGPALSQPGEVVFFLGVNLKSVEQENLRTNKNRGGGNCSVGTVWNPER